MIAFWLTDLAFAPARWTIVTDGHGRWGYEMPFGHDPIEVFNTEDEAIRERDKMLAIYYGPKPKLTPIEWKEAHP